MLLHLQSSVNLSHFLDLVLRNLVHFPGLSLLTECESCRLQMVYVCHFDSQLEQEWQLSTEKAMWEYRVHVIE